MPQQTPGTGIPGSNPPTHATPDASGHIEHGAERVKQATSSAADSARAATDRVEAGMHHGTDKVADAAEYAAEHGGDAYRKAKEHAGDWMDEARCYVRDKPLQSVAIALAAGWLAGRLLHRH